METKTKAPKGKKTTTLNNLPMKSKGGDAVKGGFGVIPPPPPPPCGRRC